MVEINVEEAEMKLSELLLRAAAGEEVVISQSGQPLAKLVRVEPPKRERQFGLDAGTFEIPDDFEDPLPEFEEDM